MDGQVTSRTHAVRQAVVGTPTGNTTHLSSNQHVPLRRYGGASNDHKTKTGSYIVQSFKCSSHFQEQAKKKQLFWMMDCQKREKTNIVIGVYYLTTSILS